MPTTRPARSVVLAALLLTLAAPPAPAAAEEPPPHEMHEAPSPGDAVGGIGELVHHLTPCIDGMAGGFPCSNVDLLEHMPLSTIGGGNGNDIWGWTDPLTGNEYALMGRTNGTAFVDITDPENALRLSRAAARLRGVAEEALPQEARPGVAYIKVTPRRIISWDYSRQADSS